MLWAKLAYTALELLLGGALLVAALTHHDLSGVLRNAAHRELREDPGDFTARHVLSVAHPISIGREALAGAAIAAYALLKGGLVVAVLQGSQRGAAAAAAVFAMLAAVAVVALARRPSPLRLLVGGLDVAVAVVVIADARTLRRSPTRRARR